MDPATLVLGGIGAVAAVFAVPAAVTALGFTATGITAGSIGSYLMSLTATASGGGVAAGSLVSILQSIGAAGFTLGGNTVVGAVGAAAGVVARMFV